MKKIFSLFAVLAVTVSVIFAEKQKVIGATFAYSYEKVTLGDQYYSANNIDFGFSSMSIADDGFSVLWELDIGKTKSSDIFPIDDYTLYNAGLKLGIGNEIPLPFPIDKLVVVGHGFVRLGVKAGPGGDESGKKYVNGELYDVTEDYFFSSLGVDVGADARIIYKATEHIGLFAGLDLYVPLYTKMWYDINVEYKGRSDKNFELDLGDSGFGKLGFSPRIGVCVVY